MMCRAGTTNCDACGEGEWLRNKATTGTLRVVEFVFEALPSTWSSTLDLQPSTSLNKEFLRGLVVVVGILVNFILGD